MRTLSGSSSLLCTQLLLTVGTLMSMFWLLAWQKHLGTALPSGCWASWEECGWLKGSLALGS